MKITGKTRVLGIIGWPVTHSLSPVMYNAAFEYLGLDFCYLPFLVKGGNLDSAIKGIPALNIAGLNVTIPYKESVLPYLSEISKEAKIIGAVNTIKVKEKSLIGYNTDGVVFISYQLFLFHFNSIHCPYYLSLLRYLRKIWQYT